MGNKQASSLKDVSTPNQNTKSQQPQSARSTGMKESASYSNDDSDSGNYGVIVKAQPLGLSAYQKSLLRDAWQRIGKKGASSIGSQIFRRMFDRNSDIKKVFQHVTVIEGVFSAGLTSVQAYQHHSELFIEILDDSIINIDDLNSLIPKLNDYGAKHAQFKAYGFKAEYWDVFGEAMIAAAREWEGWRKHRETLRAWTLLISFLVDRMRQGYESTVRRPGMVPQYSVQQNHSQDDDADDNGVEDDSTSKRVEKSNSEDQINSENDEKLSENVHCKNSASNLSETFDQEDEDKSPRHLHSF